MYGWSRFAKKLNILNSVNSMCNCVCYMHGMSKFAEKLNIQNCINSTENCVHSMYGLSRFIENLNYAEMLNIRYSRYSIFLQIQTICTFMYTISHWIYAILDI